MEECLRQCEKGFPASPTHENTLTIKTVPPGNTCGKALWTGHDPAIQICFMIFSCQNSLLPAMRNLRSDVTPSKRFFTLPPHLRSSSAQPPSSCFLHLQHLSPHIAYMKASPQAWRRHGTRHEQCDTFMTHTHPPHHRNNGGYGLRCADWYEKEGNVSRHRPLGISNIWKKKLTITMFKY